LGAFGTLLGAFGPLLGDFSPLLGACVNRYWRQGTSDNHKHAYASEIMVVTDTHRSLLLFSPGAVKFFVLLDNFHQSNSNP
jgi:hypothetical protein